METRKRWKRRKRCRYKSSCWPTCARGTSGDSDSFLCWLPDILGSFLEKQQLFLILSFCRLPTPWYLHSADHKVCNCQQPPPADTCFPWFQIFWLSMQLPSSYNSVTLLSRISLSNLWCFSVGTLSFHDSYILERDFPFKGVTHQRTGTSGHAGNPIRESAICIIGSHDYCHAPLGVGSVPSRSPYSGSEIFLPLSSHL